MKDSKFKEAYLEIIKESWTGAAGGALVGGAAAGPVGAIGGALVGSQLGNQENQDEAGVAPVDAPVEGETPAGEAVKVVTFKTTDQALVDAINNGFDEVVFFVHGKDEATGEDTVNEVKVTADAFDELSVADCECGQEGCPCEGGEGAEQEESPELTEDTLTEGDEGGDGALTGENAGEVDPSEWVEDGFCVKCGKSDCDGSCKCPKCGSVNCIGDCEQEPGVDTECGEVTAEGDETAEGGDGEGGDVQ